MIQHKTIEYLAYLIKDAKNNGNPKPIVILGAGASISAGIPSADGIAQMIIDKYSDNPEIQLLDDKEKIYTNLMGTLTPNQRNTFLKELIDKAQINVTHIYLAQMMALGFIDYFLTVNFDNLMQRALALFNIFPPTYDISILKDVTTTSFHPKSITYLHGQHTGFWLLNTKEEMDKVKEVVPSSLNKITNGRPLIIIGYSGNDSIFDHIVKLGRFDSGLYWVGYQDYKPSKTVIDNLLDKPNTNAFLIQGYDSDSFCLKLNTELGNPEPQILDKPFSFLQNTLNNIVDIEDGAIYKDIKVRLDVTVNNVKDSILRYELGIPEEEQMSKEEINLNVLKQEIINAIIKKDYSNAEDFLVKAQEVGDTEINYLLSNFYSDWALATVRNLTSKQPNYKQLYEEAYIKFDKAKELDNSNVVIFVNYGSKLVDYARTLKGEEKGKFITLALIEYKNGEKLSNQNFNLYNNWGNALYDYSGLLEGKTQMNLLLEAITKFERSIELNPAAENAYNGWALSLQRLALLSSAEQKANIFFQSFDKLETCLFVNPKNARAYANYAVGLIRYSETLGKNEKIKQIEQAISKCLKGLELCEDNADLYSAIINCLIAKAHTLIGEDKRICLEEALYYAKKGLPLGCDFYNIGCVYALLESKSDALNFLKMAIESSEIPEGYPMKDLDWGNFIDDEDFKRIVLGKTDL